MHGTVWCVKLRYVAVCLGKVRRSGFVALCYA